MTRHLLARICCAALLVVSSVAWANLSRDDAAAVAQRFSGGRVLSVDRADLGGRPVWRAKVLTPSGEVRVIRVDVATGQVL